MKKNSKIKPENIKSGVNIFDILGTNRSNIKLFSTIEEMNNDNDKYEGDIAIIYNPNKAKQCNYGTSFRTIYCPQTITLPKHITQFYDENDSDIYYFEDWETGETGKWENNSWEKYNLLEYFYIDDDNPDDDEQDIYNNVYMVGASLGRTLPEEEDPETGEYVPHPENQHYYFYMTFGCRGDYYDRVYPDIASEKGYSGHEILAFIEYTSQDGIHFTSGSNGKVDCNGWWEGEGSEESPRPASTLLDSFTFHASTKFSDTVTPDDWNEIYSNFINILTPELTNMFIYKDNNYTSLDMGATSDASHVYRSDFIGVSGFETGTLQKNSDLSGTDLSLRVKIPKDLRTLSIATTTDSLNPAINGEDLSYSQFVFPPIIECSDNITSLRNLYYNGSMSYLGDEAFPTKCIDVSKINTSNVTDVYCMFLNNRNLVEIFGIENFNLGKIADMGKIERMFGGCPKLSDNTLNNILKALSTFNPNLPSNYIRKLSGIGLTADQIAKCKTLDNWSLAEAAGWVD